MQRLQAMHALANSRRGRRGNTVTISRSCTFTCVHHHGTCTCTCTCCVCEFAAGYWYAQILHMGCTFCMCHLFAQA
jgi:hypothetical protein